MFPNWFIFLAWTVCYGGVTAPIAVSYGDSALVWHHRTLRGGRHAWQWRRKKHYSSRILILTSNVMGTWPMLMRALQNTTQKWHLKSTTMHPPLYYWVRLLVLISTPMIVELTSTVVWSAEPTKIHVMAQHVMPRPHILTAPFQTRWFDWNNQRIICYTCVRVFG